MKLFRGWTIVAAAHGLLALAFGAAYSFGAFFKSIQTQFDAGRFSVGSLFAVTALLYYCVGAVAGPLADRIGLRRVTAAGILLLATLALVVPLIMRLRGKGAVLSQIASDED